MIQYILPGFLFICSGAMEALMDTLAFHNNSTDNFWSYQSYLNKYRNHDPAQGQTFKGKYLTFLCDGWHFAKLWNHLLIFTSVVLLVMNNYSGYLWWQYGMVGLGAWLCRGIGFNIGWRILK